MKRLAAALALVLGLIPFGSSPAMAAPGSSDGGAGPALGIDVSWPQCGASLPADGAFAIVGVNGGRASTTNPCLADQLRWAVASRGGTFQSTVQLYVNTDNPGGPSPSSSWPGSGSTPYGTCDGSGSTACSWQYGWDRAMEDMAGRLAPAAQAAGLLASPSAYTWWLDVETGNTWQADAAGNRAVLEGMAAAFSHEGVRVGVYSSPYMWEDLIGTVSSTSPLYTLNSWLPGALSAEDAAANCKLDPLMAGGHVVLTQYTTGLDYNYPCGG
ncbi:hypothetical protein GCM10012320_23410 [Sinomonas cellulolyticus]|uniref:Uncharacterized protein n=1 Tax=Sinomonas cellulolyticus TaxID=2801916 RepID=A0ABS1K987_9MICC|nr:MULTISPECIES: hypothetical protein [Sinomonas]MBL0706871.1 hypothetical protein [Sinomonas cellulolyticus]GHG52908.1 hypothetical protein GCM10012320_23410 [Sinomonas sp. KCTC 49339]